MPLSMAVHLISRNCIYQIRFSIVGRAAAMRFPVCVTKNNRQAVCKQLLAPGNQPVCLSAVCLLCTVVLGLLEGLKLGKNVFTFSEFQFTEHITVYMSNLSPNLQFKEL